MKSPPYVKKNLRFAIRTRQVGEPRPSLWFAVSKGRMTDGIITCQCFIPRFGQDQVVFTHTWVWI